MSSRKPKSPRGRAFGILSLVLAALAWWFFAPQAVGGPVAYTVVTGQSMQPTLFATDLAIVRERPAYSVGDAVAYRSESLNRVVLHRIVAAEDGQFTMQGDNNDFLDADHPSANDVLGELWLRVPRAGVAVDRLRTPAGFAILGVGAVSFLGLFSAGERRRRRPAKHRRTEPADKPETSVASPTPSLPAVQDAWRRRRVTLRVVALAMGASLLASLGLGLSAFSSPLFRARPAEIEYEHRGSFDYSAAAPDGPVYQTDRIAAGEPIFVRLVDRMQIDFEYELASDAPRGLELTGRMDAVLRSADGWSHRIGLVASHAMGDRLSMSGHLDIAAIRRLLGRIEELTGMAPGTYTVSIEPRIEMEGTIAGESVTDTFRPVLPLRLNDIQIGVMREQTPTGQQSLAQVLRPMQTAVIRTTRAESAPFSIGGFEVPLLAVRRIAIAAGGLSFAGLIVLALVWHRRRPGEEAERIAARYGSMLISVADTPDLNHETVDVTDFETLVRLAQQFEQPIMHRCPSRDAHSYVLYYDGLAYRYSIGGDATPAVPLTSETPARVHAVLTRPMAPVPDIPTEQDIGLSG